MCRFPKVLNGTRAGVVRWVVTGALLAPLLLTMGCYNRILRADFNEYSGQPVNGPIPGIPDGDRIEAAVSASIVNDENLEGRSLHIGEHAEFVPAEHDVPDEYRIDWDGFRHFQGEEGISRVSFVDDDDDVALRFEFDGTSGAFRISGMEGLPVQYLTDLPHVIQVVIDMRGLGSFDLSIEQADDFSPSEWNNIEFLDGDFDELSRIVFQCESNAPYDVADLDVFTMTQR